MYAVAINTHYVELSLPATRNFAVNHSGTFVITSTDSDLRISEGKPIVVVEPANNGLVFSFSGHIESVGEVNSFSPSREKLLRAETLQLPKPKDEYRHPFTFVLNRILRENNSLGDLEYSLKAVYRYNKPEVHFHRQSRVLPKNDFETIINGHIYAARTVFGKLVNAIPRQNKLEFMLQAMSQFSTIDFKKVPLQEGLKFLNEYINKRILSRGRLLVKTNELLRTKLADILPANEIGFISQTNDFELSISDQADIFNNLFELERVKSVPNLFNDAIKGDPALEERFEIIFKNETWPIDLNYE